MAEINEIKPEWIKMKPAEVENLILSLSKEGHTPAKIGIILRDKYGIPKSKLVTNKRISKVILENKQEVPSEKSALKKKMEVLDSHILKHKHDYCAQRSLAKKKWAINKLKN